MPPPPNHETQGVLNPIPRNRPRLVRRSRRNAGKATKLREVDPKIAASFHFAEAAGKKIRNTASQKRRTGNDDPMLTGGGKTCLTTRFIHLANTVYLRRQHGLVLWIIPNSQISNQTLAALSLTGSSPISPLPTAR